MGVTKIKISNSQMTYVRVFNLVLAIFVEVEPIWFDSMGAKSTCTRVETEESSVLIDPGAAAMQPSYPMSDSQKIEYRNKARRRIQEAGEDAEHVVISHYHYDHHFLPDFDHFDSASLFGGSKLWIKDPNRWINNSQWDRAREFIGALCSIFEGESFDQLEVNPQTKKFEDPVPGLSRAMNKDFGDYQERRNELLDKWSGRFESWSSKWSGETWIGEPDLSVPVKFAEGRELQEGDTRIEFSDPLFHGIEYSQTGWVFATTVTDGSGCVFLHTSDIQGPTIEDYADWIIEKDPDYLIMDGPATYLYGYMLNRTNLDRAIDNAVRILREAEIDTFIYDHHLLRDEKYKERTRKFWEAASGSETKVGTAAEVKGLDPKILQVSERS